MFNRNANGVREAEPTAACCHVHAARWAQSKAQTYRIQNWRGRRSWQPALIGVLREMLAVDYRNPKR